MINIREEIQVWLELVTRTVKNIPFDKNVDWFDVEDVYNGSYSKCNTPMFITHDNKELSFETLYCDAVSIDHMNSEILEEDFKLAMKIIKRYKGVILADFNNFS